MRIFLTVLLGLLAPVAVVGGGLVAETVSHDNLTDEVVDRVEATYPGWRITDSNVRGRPYVVSAAQDRVSTAYVDLAVREGSASLLVQELDLATDVAERTALFVTVPYPAPATPVAGPNEISPRARVGGQVVTFSARLQGERLRVGASAGPSPRSVDLPGFAGMRIARTPVATDRGVVVELEARRVPLRRA